MNGAVPAPFADEHPTTLDAAVKCHAARAPQSKALVDAGRSVSYSELASLLANLDAALYRSGIGRNGRVGLIVPPGLPGAQLVVAIACNATLVPINAALTKSEVIDLAASVQLQAVVVPSWISQEVASYLDNSGIILIHADLDATNLVRFSGPATAGEIERVARSSDIAILLRTSGTTGQPKVIPVSNLNLLAMADKISQWFGITQDDRAACTLPLYYAGGLKTTLFGPLTIGASVAFPSPDQIFDAATWIESLSPTYLTAVPASLNGLVERLEKKDATLGQTSLRFVLCGGSQLPEALHLRAEAALGVPVLEFYALSEAGVMAANSLQPGGRKAGTVGMAAPGQLMIVAETLRPAPVGAIGEIAVSGPSVTPGYIEGDKVFPPNGGWLLTGDLGRVDEEGFLTVVGRVKEIINRGAEKVFPSEVEKALLKHPCVKEASVFGVPHPRLGEIVGAAVVLREGSHVGSHDLLQFMRGEVSEFKVPRRILLLDQLPKGHTGKVSRLALAELMVSRVRNYVSPRNELERMIAATWEEYLGPQEFGVQDDFFDLGGDSIQSVQMLVQVEQQIGAAFPNAALGGALTIEGLARAALTSTQPEHELITKVQDGAQAPFFFCHGEVWPARGMYAWKIAKYLKDTPMFLLHPYTRDRKNVFATVEELAQAYIPHILAAAPSGPVRVGGFCNGGLLAWEIAQQLTARGREVQALVLLETMSLNAQPANAFWGALIAKATGPVPARHRETVRSLAMRVVWMVAGRQRILRLALSKVRAHGLKAVLDSKNHGLVVKNIRSIATQTGPFIRILAKYVPKTLNTEVLCVLSETTKDRRDHAPRAWERLAPRVSYAVVTGDHDSQKNAHIDCLATTIAAFLSAARAPNDRPPASNSREIGARPAQTRTLPR